MRYIYYCPNCRKAYSLDSDYVQDQECIECKSKLIPTHVTDEAWHAKTDEEKEAAKKDFDDLAKATAPSREASSAIAASFGTLETFESQSKDFFSTIGGIVIAIGILAGIIVAAVYGKTTSGAYYTFHERSWPLTIGLFLMVSVPCCFFGLVMGAIAEALTALERICNNLAKLPNVLDKK